MSHKSILPLLILCLLLIIDLKAQMSFVLNNYTLSPNYAKSLSSAYTFSFSVFNPTLGTLKLAATFPNNFALSAVTGCQIKLDSTVLTGTSCQIDPTINQISINNIALSATFSTIQVKFSTATSKYSGTSTVQFNFINGTSSSVITTNRQLLQIANAQMPCSLTSNSTVVGAPASYTVQFTPSVIVESGSVIQLQFDTWGPYNRSNFITTSTTSICSGQCTISLLTNFQLQLVIFSSLFPSGSNAQSTITLNSVRNPASFAPLKLKILVLGSDGSSVYMVGDTTLTVNTTNTFNGIVFDLPNKNISATNPNINLRITPRQPINWNTYLRIIYPSSLVSLGYSFAFSSLSTAPSEINGQPSGQMLIGNLTRITITSQPTLLSMGNFTFVNPPFGQKPISITFRTQQLINSIYYYVDQTTVQFTGSASTITQSGVKAQLSTIGSVTTYDVWFVTINRLISGSFITIIFPSQIQLNPTLSTCTLSNNGISSTCNVLSSNSLRLTSSQIINAGTNLTLTVSRVTNSLLTSPSSSFTISQFYMDDQSLVDQLTTGLTVTASQTTMKSVIVSPSSFTVNAKAVYTFSIQPTFSLPAGTVIKITFPQQLNSGGQTLQSFAVDSTTVSSGCSVTSSSNNQLTLSSGCITTQVKNTSTITIKISNVTNPSSFKPIQSFLIEAFNGIYRQEYLSNGIIVTMNQTSNLSYFKVIPNSFTANDLNLYTFEVTFQVRHYSGDQVLIKLPSDVLLSSTFDCSSLTANLTISCSKYDSTTVLFIMNFADGSLAPQQSVKFTLSNLTNIWYATTRTFSIQTTTNDTIFYFQQQASNVVNYQPASISASINNDNNIILLGQSKLMLTLSSPYKLDKVNNNYTPFFITIQVPIELTPINNTCSLSNVSSVCSLTSSQTLNVTQIGDISSPMTLTFTAQTAFFQTSSSFDIKLYYSTNIVQSNSLLTAKRFCQLPCKQCISTNSACLSCLPSPYVAQTIYFSFNNTCVSQCPDTYFLNSTDKSCGKCSSTCSNCINSANQCTSCPTGRYLFNKTCMAICPNGYYALNSQCLQCSSPCATCTGQATSCLTCVSGNFLDNGSNSSRCVTSCTNSNYLGLEGQCRQCTNNCKTCSVSLTNCTSCDETIYRFYQNSCIRNCPVGMYTSAVGTCSNCVQPCLTCTTRLNCLSCVSNYYLYNGTNCVTECPDGFLQRVSECVGCDSKCATCEVTLTNCTSCPSGSYYYQNDCYTTCPQLTYPYNRTCTRCISPCVTCSSSPQLCLSCIEGLLLLNNTCVNQCPLSGYIKDKNQCLRCPQNCLTCSTSINCTFCNNSFYLLQGACTSSCPANYPIVTNRQCQQCSSECLTCSTSKQNCTSCKIGYFKHLYTCVQECPLGYYSNVMSYECEDGLSRKIVFFPLLIISVIILAFVIVAKLLTLQTSFPPALVSLLSLSQVAIWIYMMAELAAPIKQLNVEYTLPIAMNIIALVALLALNIGFFYFELKRMQQDDFVKGWASNNVNFTVLTVHRYIGLIINFKFFRFCYSRFFNIRSLSLPFKKNQNIFPLTTTFSILNFVLCQIPMLVCAFSLVYKKTLKDQLFYTSIQCLVITVGCAIILLIDIFKSEDYFEESDYVKTRKYLEKIKDASFNQLEDNFDIEKDTGSIDAEKFVSKTGGKFVFSKEDPSSLKQLFFQEQDVSAMTQALQTIQVKNEGKSQNSPQKDLRKSGKRINIFDPIKEEDQQIYDELKYTDQQVKTQAQIEEMKKQDINSHKEEDTSMQEQESRAKRLMSFGINTDKSNWEETRSMIEERPLKQKWNNIINHRQRLARSIFNTMDGQSSKELEMIIEPIQQDDYEEDQRQGHEYRKEGDAREDPFRFTEYGKVKRVKRRKRKQANQQPTNSQLQKIYLQRLTEKKSHKNIYASSQSVKYDF